MNIKKIIAISSLAIFIVLTVTLAISVKIKSLNRQIAQSKNALLKMTEESARIKEQEERVAAENEKLKADTVSYVSLNTKLQGEKEKMQKAVNEAQKIIENKEGALQRAQSRLNQVEKGLAEKKSKERESLIREKKALTKKILSLDSTIKFERALYHYNLGVAYSQAKLYEDAIDEYEKSLKENSDNPDAHYNIAVIYDTVFGDAQSALSHYEEYLDMSPDSEDREEVESCINRLK